MKRYRPMERSFSGVNVPEDFTDILVDAAESGCLFPRPISVRAEVLARRPDYVAVRVVDEAEVLTLRFDTMEVWRIDDQTIRFRVSYRGWFKARMREALDVGFMHAVVALFVSVVLMLAVFLPEAFAGLSWIGGAESGDPEAVRPDIRALGKHLSGLALLR